MFLSYNDMAELFPERRGIQDPFISYESASIFSNDLQPKGLFIPAVSNSGDLKQAIENGAISALWERGIETPSYTPNHFPIFLTDNLSNGIQRILHFYVAKLEQEKEIEEVTNILFSKESFSQENDNNLVELLNKLSKVNEDRKEGMK